MSLLPLEQVTDPGLGNKIRLLARAKLAGLPVPQSYVLLDGFEAYSCPLSGPMAVRSAFSLEDRQEQSGAGMFVSKLGVRPAQFAGAVDEVRRSADRVEACCRKDVLVMRMVEASHAGVAFLQPNFLDDYVEYVAGLADDLLGGRQQGQQLFSSRLHNNLEHLSFGPRLQRLLRSVWAVFGEEGLGWDIEWADDGRECWLLQVRPITRAPLRNEWLTYANIREILPDPPSVLMTDIVLRGSKELYGYYQNFDPTLPRGRDLIEEVHGRPVFNLSLLCETIRWWGLPSRLVTDNIGGEHGDPPSPLQVTRVLQKLPVLLRQLWSQLTCIRQARMATAKLAPLRQKRFESLAECGQAACLLFTDLVKVMLNLTAALSAPLAMLRRLGVLAQHSARHRSISTSLYEDLVPLQEAVEQHPQWLEALQQGRVPDDPNFQKSWDRFLAKHGHRGIYESDLARPRYRERPEPLLKSLCLPTRHSSSEPAWTPLAYLTAPLWWWCSAVLRAREKWRYESMKCYEHLRLELLRLSPVGEQVFQLHLDELAKLDSGDSLSGPFWKHRDQLIQNYKEIDLPHTFRRFSPLRSKSGPHTDLWQGVGLSSGRVEGKAWVLSTPSSELPALLEGHKVVLIARTVDAGWIPTFRLVDAVAVELGGDLSHGSIILRELGFPAVTSAAGVWSGLSTGDHVQLDADRGYIQRLVAGE